MNASDIAATLLRSGQAVTIEGGSSTGYDTATGAVTSSAYSASGSAVPLPLNPYKAQKDSNILAGDERLLLSALVAKPPIGATITLADGTTKYTLISIEPLHPAGAELLWDCVVRGH